MRYFRIQILSIIGILGAMALAQSQSLMVERRGDQLQIAAPRLHFLTGKALDKLHNGSTVNYVLALTVSEESGRSPVFFVKERFVVSFDLWEEKYSIVQKGSEGRAISHLSATMAEAWFLENVPIPVRAVPEKKPFVIKFECSINEIEEESESKTDSGLTLAGLIEVFSRKKREEPLHWEASVGPLRLSELKNAGQIQ
jgi:hypothetical protein